MGIGFWKRLLGGVISLAVAMALPGAAVGQTPASCVDAKAHFDLAKEFGTREALQLHIDSYAGCPFAPFAKMLMDRMPAEDVPPAAADAAVLSPADADRQAQALVAWLSQVQTSLAGGTNEFRLIYERAEKVGADTRIYGLQLVYNYGDRRFRFAEALLVLPHLSDAGLLSAARLELKGGEAGQLAATGGDWSPGLSTKELMTIDSVVLFQPRFLASGEVSADGLAERLRASLVEINGFKLSRKNDPQMYASLAALVLVMDPVSNGWPQRMGVKLTDLSMPKTAFAKLRIGVPQFGETVKALDYETYTFSGEAEVVADPVARTLDLTQASLEMDGAFGASMRLELSGVDLETLVDEVVGRPRPADAGMQMEETVALDVARFAYFDKGLVDRLLALTAKSYGVDSDLFKAALPAQAQVMAQIFGSKELGQQVLAATTDFIKAPNSLELTFEPSAPVLLKVLAGRGSGDEVGLKAVLNRLQAKLLINGSSIDIGAFATAAATPPETPASANPVVTAAAMEASATCMQLAGGPSGNAEVHAAAVPACENARRFYPSDDEIANRLAHAYVAATRLEDAFRLFTIMASSGNPDAEFEVARAFVEGRGTPVDTGKGIQMLERLAEVSPKARSFLGIVTYDGIGVPADRTRAIELWQAGADKREADSLYQLSIELLVGTQLPIDAERARGYLTDAAAQGHSEAIAELGKMFYRGSGGPQDYNKAFEQFALAVEGGSATGLANGGFMLAAGVGTEKDVRKGAEWMLRALAKKNSDSVAYLIEEEGKSFDAPFRTEIQTQLKEKGIYDGPISGLFGRQTRDALKALRDGGDS